MLIIGERINSSRKPIFQAIASRDGDFIRNEAKAQSAAGAHYIDVNAGAFGEEEAEHLKWVIDVVQDATELPLCIDSPDPTVVRSVLPLLEQAAYDKLCYVGGLTFGRYFTLGGRIWGEADRSLSIGGIYGRNDRS